MYSSAKTIWDYISLSLTALGISENELCDLLNVTKTTIYNWKKRKDNESGGISKDKIIFLCNLFRVSLDEFYQRMPGADIINEFVYKLDGILLKKDFKNLRYLDLKLLFEESIPYAKRLIEGYANGYFIRDNGEKDILDEEDRKELVDPDGEIDYFCHKLKLGLILEPDDVSDIFCIEDAKSLQKINPILKHSKHYFKCVTTYDYDEILLLSENILYISDYINKGFTNANKLINLYELLRNKYRSFDISGNVYRLLILKGGIYMTDGHEDFEKSFKRLKEINDMEIDELLIKEKQEKEGVNDDWGFSY